MSYDFKDKPPFVAFRETQEKNEKDITFTTRITPSVKEWFEPAKLIIKQPKNSTALKQLAYLGYIYVTHDPMGKACFELNKENSRRIERNPVSEEEYKIVKN
jgi:hypothetical protein